MKCSYCSGEIKRGSGIMYVFRDGRITYFCSSKCYKNGIKLGRKIKGSSALTVS
ncbi:MAG: 50S ribosomal protein L24e [Candidatus Micrarchaeia archaeon]